jgi:cation/acetate symporter
MFLVAEPLRNLGKFTFADVVAFRLRQKPVRIAAAIGGILTVLFYTIAQMVGSGSLIQLMFGLPYVYAEIIVGVVMLAYVLFGGMLATTWVQIIKAVLLLFGVTLLTILVLNRFGWNPGNLYSEVVGLYGQKALEPGGLVTSPIEAISLGLALMFGLLGLPHILMRFYTVPDAKAARKSVLYATGLIGYFYVIIPIVGFGAAVLVGRPNIALDKFGGAGGNMAAPLLAELLGGTPFLGFIAAVAFATILAVVSGLALAGASAISHDLYARVIKKGQVSEEAEIRVSKMATVGLGVVAIALGILFEKQNIAFMVGLAFGVAAAANFPVLILSMYWKGLTTRGALAGGYTGLFSAVFFVLFSKSVWVTVLGNARPLFPYDQPALFAMPLAFAAAILVSRADASARARAESLAFEDQYVRAQTGFGATAASKH